MGAASLCCWTVDLHFETGHLVAWAIQSGMTVERALEMPFYHPVIEEGLRTALRDAQAKLHSARLRAAA